MVSLLVVKRNGDVVDFDFNRISNAIQKAANSSNEVLPQEILDKITGDILNEVEQRFVSFYPNVENVQDIVEKHLMKNELFRIAKEYILYRAKRHEVREEERKQTIEKSLLGKLSVIKRDGKKTFFDINKVKKSIKRASKSYEDVVFTEQIAKEVVKNVYDGILTEEISKALILATVSFIEKDPAYDYISARLYLQKIYKEVIGNSLTEDIMGLSYRESFIRTIREGVKNNILNEKMLDFDLEKLSYGLKLDRDELFEYIGIQTIYDRYLVKLDNNKRIELPQSFWMRVAMGLCLNEQNKTERALEFYEVMSSMRYVPSTPTLFNSGLIVSQLSSCYLTTIKDDLYHIFKCISDNAQLSKWAGGIGNDWTNIRSTGSMINGIGSPSQGVVPFLKIANDTTVAISRSGKRRGGTCAYLETWHLDIEDFLDLKKNTGDERRRTHEMNTANWIPDLFIKRVLNDENWTLFSPNEVSELHELYGRAFEKKYTEYEEKAQNGMIKKHKVVSAVKLWRKMLSMLFETGHPWITFKDVCNIRSPQDHCGVVHSSNLCTEITLNTSEEETAVCNLGSVNLERHFKDGKINEELIGKTVRTAVRMLDNVIDLNFYPTIEAKNSNLRHRPVGLGIMGFQDALFKLRIPFDSPNAINFADQNMELISYYTIMASCELAKERGAYSTFSGSKWDRGIFPLDTLNLLEQERGFRIDVNRDERLDWTSLKANVKQFGMRNSNVMAIAPTATISNIVGSYPCIEPIYKNIYVKSNISGEFTVVNRYLVEDLKKLGMWNQDMLDQIKYYDGNLQMIANIPQEIKDLYKEAFELDSIQGIKMTAVRGKWIDQSQSHNVFMNGLSGKKISDVYINAWKFGLKTTYYLRTMAASQIEKSTLDAGKFGFTQKRSYKEMENITQTNETDSSQKELISKNEIELVHHRNLPRVLENPNIEIELSNEGAASVVGKICNLLDPDCEACQ